MAFYHIHLSLTTKPAPTQHQRPSVTYGLCELTMCFQPCYNGRNLYMPQTDPPDVDRTP